MTHKNKVKELVGGGLNAYHTKALQQMDRIEKKNKEQNHKISMLTNELDNDYLTKTEEGSVVSLEHSKEGMVYIDSLEGNTLVNYCTDGSKELTLNGDIDLEGTFVTTTEGVDNGLVDVYCEGNTLVNLKLNSGQKCNVSWQNSNTVEFFKLNENSYYHLKGEIVETANILKFGWCYGTLGQFQTELLKPNTTYTLILNNSYDWIKSFSLMQGNATNSYHKVSRKISKNIYTITTKDSFEGLSARDIILYAHIDGDYKGNIDCSIIAMLEGDWSEKEIPKEYFEGMKSVGQDDENGHKIEILSRNDNLFVPTQHIPNGWSNGNMIVSNNYRSYWIKCKPNTTYFVESDRSGNRFGVCCSDRIELNGVAFPVTKGGIFGSTDDTNKVQSTIFTTDASAKYLYVYTINNGVFPTPKIMISEGSSVKTYIEPKLNKKEILLNEPLRSLPNGVKDRFVKIGGKLFIERNCGEMYINVPSSGVSIDNIQEGRCRIIMADYPSNILPNQNRNTVNLVCDKIPYVKQYDIDGTNPNYSYGITTRIDNAKGIYMWVTIDKMPNQTLDGFKEFINNTQPKIIYQLETPIYEPLEIEPTLSCYSEVTHFSNNSIIPCNMKIQNSGYNAIIKPSTLYTIALDTNKSGTIGMNLGGVKGTTTNNVLKLTTPATLTDDSLRLYGKGIKGSKVRLLEGDKTNWIPSHFEGMKSSFEDKFDTTDNTYKMEILSSNKNMFNKIDAMKPSNWLIGTYHSFKMQLKPNTRYSVSVNYRTDKPRWMGIFEKPYNYDGMLWAQVWNNGANNFYKSKFTTPKDGVCYLSVYSEPNTIEDRKQLFNEVYNDLTIQEEIFGDEPIIQNSNKIQFSSIEPLRKWDRLVFNDGHLMIERGTRVHIINNETKNIGISTYGDKIKTMAFTIPTHNINENDILICKDFTNAYVWDDFEHCHSNKNIINITINRKRLLTEDVQGFLNWLENNPITIYSKKTEPTYEEIPFELQKIILEGYENGTLFFDTNIPPTSTITYAGETPIVKSVRLNKTEVLNNTTDINDNIIPYLMDMDYRVVCLELATETQGISMARLFGGVYEMLKRDIQSRRYSVDEYRHRLDAYLSANKITEDEYNKLGDMLNE